ncbi:SusD family protein [Mariniphaga anaerophila]|uniref:SusD family protein n=1 Tax=Mariniphaga anaerophila TaxID=1484053 RepID=A0A1M4SW91_9BACT|nr:RagB/SusD family nutrient uptake outer membrane protein [Mariniphaga anaerophila]SHE36484.1 SusD family protein [Mariniphaga anaerophila]
MKYIVTVLISLLLLSCEDFFQEVEMPADILTTDISSNKELEQLVSSAYFAWQGYHEGICDLSFIIPSFASDEGIISASHDINVEYGNHDQLYNRNTWNNSIPYLQYVWQSGYGSVHFANLVLTHLNSKGPFNDSEIGWADRMKGEAYFNRAFAFYTLSKIFCPPYDVNGDMTQPGIICDTTISEGPFDTRALQSIDGTYKQIISDLNNAIQFLPEEYEENRDPESYQDRAKRDAAEFLLSRVFFQMGPEFWENSLALINEILGDNKYPLNGSPADAYTQSGLGQMSSETVFQYASYNGNSQWRYPRVYHFFSGGSASGRRKMFHMNDSFAAFVGWDNSDEAAKDLRYSELFTISYGKIWADKWKARTYSFPMMRSPELHLTRALICLLTGEGGGNQQAITDLNIVRKRAYGDNYEPLDNSYSTSELLDITHRERAIELFFEGDRLYYVQAIRGQVSPGDRTDQVELPYNSDKLYWPIPEREVFTNDNLTN